MTMSERDEAVLRAYPDLLPPGPWVLPKDITP